jgi:hypothetical protein
MAKPALTTAQNELRKIVHPQAEKRLSMRFSIFPTATALGILALSSMSIPAFAQGRTAAAPSAAPQPAAAPQDSPAPGELPSVKQLALTDKQIEDALAANTEISPIVDQLPEDAAPDPKIVAQLDEIAKKHGFTSFADYDNLTANINQVLAGFDPETKKYVGQDVVLKKEIAMVQANKKMVAAEKKETLTELNAALKSVAPLQFQGNIAVVGKYYDKLSEVMSQDKQ